MNPFLFSGVGKTGLAAKSGSSMAVESDGDWTRRQSILGTQRGKKIKYMLCLGTEHFFNSFVLGLGHINNFLDGIKE